MRTSETTTILVDRDSVAMGDDVDSHRQEWTLPARATAIDVLMAVFEQSYLARVSAPVTWVMHLGERRWAPAATRRDAQGPTHVGTERDVIAIHAGTEADLNGHSFTILDPAALMVPLTEAMPGDGPAVVGFRYLMTAVPPSVDEQRGYGPRRTIGGLVEHGLATGARPSAIGPAPEGR